MCSPLIPSLWVDLKKKPRLAGRRESQPAESAETEPEPKACWSWFEPLATHGQYRSEFLERVATSHKILEVKDQVLPGLGP